MLLTIIALPFILGIYWILWKLYSWASPHILPESVPEYVKKPAFWQFAIVILIIVFMTKGTK